MTSAENYTIFDQKGHIVAQLLTQNFMRISFYPLHVDEISENKINQVFTFIKKDVVTETFVGVYSTGR